MASDMEHFESGMVEQRPDAAVNCFSGSFQQLALLYDQQVEEPAIMEAGDGYLLKAGLDERSCPEIVFGVESVILSGLTALGYEARATAIDPSQWRRQLRDLLKEHSGVVVWVNSSHLGYADVYSSHPGFMHAILVLEMSADLSRLKVFDSLVDDRSRYSCYAWMLDIDFEAAILDRIPSKSLDHMGNFHTLLAADAPAVGSVNVAAVSLLRQAESFRDNACYSNAVHQYRLLCRDSLAGGEDAAKYAARRLFDHVNVLYVIPGLKLLERSLRRADAPEFVHDMCRTLVDDWRVLGLQALKFEATLSSRVATRIDERFERLDAATTLLWRTVLEQVANDGATA
ncbi:hypothetical protein [Streptomyces tsukubensis]|uniref:Butirosin biosynthesis protein H N-terminal domain-containing protein n=1 Tax=Streptomyces tsukubensis TaxID=83656 RepID=A0A1V4AD51_9ACTN|nr:hypothetical protein [Streptomyces tsukubensis]OON81419.1 hypothetical protein B1H18_08875 [Streptomyces tsukubensis]QFR95451.1 hypothetical protein GBW32_23555 [Streptomyces tsukubensis]